MNNLRRNWFLILFTLLTIALGVVVLLTALRLREEKPVAPTAPEKPRAIAGSPVPACQYTFTITLVSPTPIPTPTPTPTLLPTPPASPSPTPPISPIPTPSPTPTPTPVPECNTACTYNSDCPSNLICYILAGQTTGNCRNPSCQTETDCTCEAPQVSPTPAPSVTPEVPTVGVSWPTIFLIMGGMALLVLGFALP